MVSGVTNNTKVIKILIIEANPEGDLSLDKEIRLLRRQIDIANNSQDISIEFQVQDGTEDCVVVKKEQLQQLMLKLEKQEPQDAKIIVHFCGHGTETQELVFEDKNGERDFVDIKTLTRFFELFKERVACIILNACYSDIQAEVIFEHIDCVIGMRQTIKDNSAIAFATGFYTALAYGKSYEDAFKFGCNAIQLKAVKSFINYQQIAKETRKLVPVDATPEITITEEEHKPVIYSKYSYSASYNEEAKGELKQNLVHRNYKKFIGRELEVKKLIEQLSSEYRQHINIIYGIGGVGKTALALEVAYLIFLNRIKEVLSDTELKIEDFDFKAIIFTSAKQTYLTPTGIKVQPIRQRTLQDIFATIAEVLEKPNIIRANDEHQTQLVYSALKEQKTLLIIDNLETIEDIGEKERIFSFLAKLPNTTQVIITTREREGAYEQIGITELSRDESLELIQQEAETEIELEEAEQFYQYFGGIPVALIYAVGQRTDGYSMEMILSEVDPSLPKLSNNLSQFLFEKSIAPLRNQPAHHLLMSMTFFFTPQTREVLSYVAGLSEQRLEQEKGLVTLQRLSLFKVEKYRYKILSITRRFAQDEIEKKEHKNFKEKAQNRLIEFYLQFTKQYGGKDWKDFMIQSQYLEQEWENIQFVLSLCASLDRYKEMIQIWNNVDHFVDLSSRWSLRLDWWELIAERADINADIATYAKALSEKAWTLILMKNSENIEEAISYLDKAWNCRKAIDLDTQAHIANHFAVYYITEEKYEIALSWLKQQENLVARSSLTRKEKERHQVCLDYYRAEIYYQQENSVQAKEILKKVINLGKNIKWQRFTNYAQNYLVDILIKEGDLSEELNQLLFMGLYWAERSGEKRRIAHWQSSYAYYERAKGNFTKAKESAEKALVIFQQECMENNIIEMKSFTKSFQLE